MAHQMLDGIKFLSFLNTAQCNLLEPLCLHSLCLGHYMFTGDFLNVLKHCYLPQYLISHALVIECTYRWFCQKPIIISIFTFGWLLFAICPSTPRQTLWFSFVIFSITTNYSIVVWLEFTENWEQSLCSFTVLFFLCKHFYQQQALSTKPVYNNWEFFTMTCIIGACF